MPWNSLVENSSSMPGCPTKGILGSADKKGRKLAGDRLIQVIGQKEDRWVELLTADQQSNGLS